MSVLWLTSDRLSTVGARFARIGDHHGRIATEISVIRSLLEKGGDSIELGRYGWTVLHTAALIGDDADQVASLIYNGLDPGAETSSGWSALHLAAFGNSNPDVIAALVAGGANPNAVVGSARTAVLKRWYPGTVVNWRHQPKGGPSPFDDARFGDGRTPLHCAAFANPNPLVIAALLQAGSNPNARTTTGWTPLHAAVYANPNTEVAEALLNGGAEASSPLKKSWTVRDLWPYSILVYNQDDKRDHVLALDGRIVPLNGLSSPLHVAVNNPREPSVVDVLITGGADPNARDVEGETPLHQVEVVADIVALIEAGADPNARREGGYTPLHNAIFVAGIQGNLELVSALIDRGADPNAKWASGRTPLHKAAESGPYGSSFPAAGPRTDAKLISLLIRRGAKPNVQDDYGRTPLHVAANFGATEAAQLEALIQGGADPNLRNEKGESPLFHAVAPFFHHPDTPGKHELVAQLIGSGADPNLRDERGRTPLHRAVAKYYDALVIDALLAGGAKASIADDLGLTPWDLAQEHESLKGSKTYWRLNDARFD